MLDDKSMQSVLGWYAPEVAARRARLHRAGIDGLEKLREAVRRFDALSAERTKVDPVKELERALVGNKNVGIDFFPTPKATAERMVEEADIEAGMRVLEPSAGNGNIAEAIRAAGVDPDVIEVSTTLREILEARKFKLVGSDFMEVKEGGYDRIVMNPPFGGGADADHVQHAYSLLKPGGRLVAIMSEGTFIRSDKKAEGFRAWLDGKGSSEKLSDGTFLDKTLPNTTGVSARIVTIEKASEGAAMLSRATETFQSSVDRALADEAGHDVLRQHTTVAAETPQVLQILGVESKPVVTSLAALRKMHDDHRVTVSTLKRLPDLLADPAMVLKSRTQDGRLVVVTDELVGGRPLVLAIEPNGEAGNLQVVFVPSAYPKSGGGRRVRARHPRRRRVVRQQSEKPTARYHCRAPIARGCTARRWLLCPKVCHRGRPCATHWRRAIAAPRRRRWHRPRVGAGLREDAHRPGPGATQRRAVGCRHAGPAARARAGPGA